MAAKKSDLDEHKFNINVINLVKDIEKQKQTLEEIFQLIISLRNLSGSWSDLVSNTGSDNLLMKDAHDLLDSLDDEQLKFSTEKIEFRLENLELKIRDEVSDFLDLVDSSSTQKQTSLEAVDDCFGGEIVAIRISEFKRKVKLSGAYRVLLCERGVLPIPIELDVAPQLISESIDLLNKKANLYQGELLKQFKLFHGNIIKLSESDIMTDNLTGEFNCIIQQVSENIEYLSSGKPVSDIPVSLEAMNFDVRKLIMEKTEEANVEELSQMSEQQSDPVKKQGSKLIKRVNVWLDSPTSTSWKDTK